MTRMLIIVIKMRYLNKLCYLKGDGGIQMIKIYSMETCPDCINVHLQVKDNKNFKIIDIGEDVKNLKEFIRLRDTNKVFDECKKNGSIGIPCFVLEDGSITLNEEDVGLNKAQENATCSLKGGC